VGLRGEVVADTRDLVTSVVEREARIGDCPVGQKRACGPRCRWGGLTNRWAHGKMN
jgi:hypothetical protein